MQKEKGTERGEKKISGKHKHIDLENFKKRGINHE